MCNDRERCVGHRALEILVNVARMPKAYKRVRRNVLKENYTPFLNSYYLEALYILISEKQPEEVSSKARACARDIQKIADEDKRGLRP